MSQSISTVPASAKEVMFTCLQPHQWVLPVAHTTPQLQQPIEMSSPYITPHSMIGNVEEKNITARLNCEMIEINWALEVYLRKCATSKIYTGTPLCLKPSDRVQLVYAAHVEIMSQIQDKLHPLLFPQIEIPGDAGLITPRGLERIMRDVEAASSRRTSGAALQVASADRSPSLRPVTTGSIPRTLGPSVIKVPISDEYDGSMHSIRVSASSASGPEESPVLGPQAPPQTVEVEESHPAQLTPEECTTTHPHIRLCLMNASIQVDE